MSNTPEERQAARDRAALAIDDRDLGVRSLHVRRAKRTPTETIQTKQRCCPFGHPYFPDNYYVTAGGRRRCHACDEVNARGRDRRRESYDANRRVKSPRPLPAKSPKPRPTKSHCPQGHPYSGDNLRIRKSGKKACRECANAAARRTIERRKAGVIPPPPNNRTHCPKGHEYNEKNTKVTADGRWKCRICENAASRASKQRAREKQMKFGETR